MSYEGREVSIARVHAPIHMARAGNLTSPITNNSGKMLGGLKMVKVLDGLVISLNGEELFVPNGNIQSLQFKIETPNKSAAGTK